MILNAAFVFLLTFPPLVAAPGLALEVVDLTAGRTILCRQVQTGGAIVLSFTHSMYGGDVREEYEATADGRLRRVAVTTANAAAADYYASTVAVLPADGRYRIDVPPLTMSEVVIRVDRIGRHRLAVGEETVDLLEATGDRHQVLLRVERSAGWDRLLGGPC